jgi:hypothetical protein
MCRLIELFCHPSKTQQRLKHSSSNTQSAATGDAQQKMMKLQAAVGEASDITSHHSSFCVTIFDAATLRDPL